MDLKFAGKPTVFPGRTDLDQMPDTPTRRAQHRRAHSETFFRLPDLDDILIHDVVSDLNLDLPPPTPPSLLPNGQPPLHPGKADGAHLRSLSMDAEFFEGLGLEAPAGHRHSNSMDGYNSPTSFETESKKSMATDRLAEIALIDPKRAKRQSAARSKERKIRYTNELERKVQTLQAEATTLSAQITLLQRDTSGLTTQNKELKLKLQAMEQQAHLRDALNDALRNELQRLKIAAGQFPAASGNNRLPSSQASPEPPPLHQFGSHQAQHP